MVSDRPAARMDSKAELHESRLRYSAELALVLVSCLALTEAAAAPIECTKSKECRFPQTCCGTTCCGFMDQCHDDRICCKMGEELCGSSCCSQDQCIGDKCCSHGMISGGGKCIPKSCLNLLTFQCSGNRTDLAVIHIGSAVIWSKGGGSGYCVECINGSVQAQACGSEAVTMGMFCGVPITCSKGTCHAMLGGDIDEHGCKPSTGYIYCSEPIPHGNCLEGSSGHMCCRPDSCTDSHKTAATMSVGPDNELPQVQLMLEEPFAAGGHGALVSTVPKAEMVQGLLSITVVIAAVAAIVALWQFSNVFKTPYVVVSVRYFRPLETVW
mmetsp:Transcript_36388/g.60301  ORF Transcript_36388/g.60301 Transcript_36388/m.60301 type:complete len:326 (-) Transcript_36388:204-1181(-)